MVLFIFVVLIIVIAVVIFSGSNDNQIKKAGREGEMRAYSRIKSVLRADDKLYANVEVSFENKETELDFLIVNKYGVFIIEEKNFNDDLVGKEDSHTWRKRKHTDYDTYDKIIDNPIKQVKREVYILSQYLSSQKAKVWVNGYVYLLNGNKCTDSKLILRNQKEIDKVIHTQSKNLLTPRKIEEIHRIISKLKDLAG